MTELLSLDGAFDGIAYGFVTVSALLVPRTTRRMNVKPISACMAEAYGRRYQDAHVIHGSRRVLAAASKKAEGRTGSGWIARLAARPKMHRRFSGVLKPCREVIHLAARHEKW